MFTNKQIDEIEKKTGYVFKNKALVNLAFTHSSYANIKEQESNERLEFLGDSVLHLCTTKYLYEHFALPEGILSRVRSYTVSTKNLSQAIKKMGVIEYLKYTKSGSKNTSNSIEANLFEAILAGIYLDSGFDKAFEFVIQKLNYSKELFEKLIKNANDYKTQLQEVAQLNQDNILEYRLVKKEGRPHEPIFTVEVLLNNAVLGEGVGSSKKEAENMAAQKALKILE